MLAGFQPAWYCFSLVSVVALPSDGEDDREALHAQDCVALLPNERGSGDGDDERRSGAASGSALPSPFSLVAD